MSSALSAFCAGKAGIANGSNLGDGDDGHLGNVPGDHNDTGAVCPAPSREDRA